jgi:hypothetical protein
MNWGPTLTRTVDLGYEQMLLLESRQGARIKVIYGGVWLTEEGRPDDVFAASGDEVALKSRGLAVVEGLGYARVQVSEPPLGWRAWRDAAKRAIASLNIQLQAAPSAHRPAGRPQPAA